MIWRSLLYVPANVPRFLAKAQTRGADALILDLEDSVPDDRKAEARDVLAAHWDSLRAGPADLVVRINGDMRSAVHDLESVVKPGLKGIYLPKVSGPEIISHVASVLDALEQERDMVLQSVCIVPMIETPSALEAAFAIAGAHPRITGLTLGSEDFATACGMFPTPANLLAARQRVVFAAHAAGIAAYGLLDSVANLSTDGLLQRIESARDFGFSGATAVHPDAVAMLNAGFSQSEANKKWAADVIAALDAAAAEGSGATRHDGRMIDRPMQLRAQAILGQYREA